MTALYSLRSTPAADEFMIQRFDEDFLCESVYAVSTTLCTCPAGTRSTCRHRKMLPLFLAAGHIDDGWFLEWDTRLWRGPIAGELGATLADPLILDNAPSAGREAEAPSRSASDIIEPVSLAEHEEFTPPLAPAAPTAAPVPRPAVGEPFAIKRRKIT
jgi:hypothetical protein